MGDVIEIVVTDHAISRARERLGVPRRSVRRLVERAWHDGAEIRVASHYKGQLSVGRQLANGIFVFVVDGGVASCATVLYGQLSALSLEQIKRWSCADDPRFGSDHKHARRRRLRLGREVASP